MIRMQMVTKIDGLTENIKFESLMAENFWYLPIMINFEELNFEIIHQTQKNRKSEISS